MWEYRLAIHVFQFPVTEEVVNDVSVGKEIKGMFWSVARFFIALVICFFVKYVACSNHNCFTT